MEYIQANRVRTLLMQALAELMAGVDVLVTPADDDDASLLTNLTGHLAVAVPNGFAADGTPTGITFVVQLYGEAALLAVAKAYQEATSFHFRHPGGTIGVGAGRPSPKLAPFS